MKNKSKIILTLVAFAIVAFFGTSGFANQTYAQSISYEPSIEDIEELDKIDYYKPTINE